MTQNSKCPVSVEKALRETGLATPQAIGKLEIYVRMLLEWQSAINLVAPSTLPQIWERHILDSAQIWPLIVKDGTPSRIIDLGSGGGLPAIVLAILGAEHVTMIESDLRKSVFLREVSRETNLTNVTILNKRCEQVEGLKASIVTARAVASLLQLVGWAKPFLEDDGLMIFPKGQDYQNEIDELAEEFEEDLVGNIETIQSITDDKAHIVMIYND
jgi:16S rRNA (guanine527-N7)-methyltransferase